MFAKLVLNPPLNPLECALSISEFSTNFVELCVADFGLIDSFTRSAILSQSGCKVGTKFAAEFAAAHSTDR
jgi:hypothetical protein